MWKKVSLILLVLLLVTALWQYKLVFYGLSQAKGQLSIIWDAEPVEQFSKRQDVADSIKSKLVVIREAKAFATDSLGINPTDNYTTIYDQKGKPVLWVVTACDPFKLEAKEWGFPIIGSFSYKGFFDYHMAVQEKATLQKKGYDTGIRTVGGWSTLGWFKDPILSNMLLRSEGDLVELIIHELTHGTIFVKDSVSFNENLASFIGERGAKKYLDAKYGSRSLVLEEYNRELLDYEKYVNHFLRGAEKLDSLYNSMEMEKELPVRERKSKKDEVIKRIISSIDTVSFHDGKRYKQRLKERNLNNTFFMAFLRYRAKQEDFEAILNEDFGGDLKKFVTYFKNKHPYL